MSNRYRNIPQDTIKGKQAYKTSRYPEVPLSENDLYVYTTQGDRFDTLANLYYGDSSLWWIISIANTDVTNQSSLNIPIGTQIIIPNNYASVIKNFKLINE